MAITLTETAARHVAAHLTKSGKGVGLRLGVRTSGCSGLAYKLEYADDVRPEDMQFESHGVQVIVDPKSLPYLDGTELDFAREGLNGASGSTIRTCKDACGCGEIIQRLSCASSSRRRPRRAVLCEHFLRRRPMIDFSRNHFELFGLPLRYRDRRAALDAPYRALQSDVHPDRFAAAATPRSACDAGVRARQRGVPNAAGPGAARAVPVQLHGVDATPKRTPLAGRLPDASSSSGARRWRKPLRAGRAGAWRAGARGAGRAGALQADVERIARHGGREAARMRVREAAGSSASSPQDLDAMHALETSIDDTVPDFGAGRSRRLPHREARDRHRPRHDELARRNRA